MANTTDYEPKTLRKFLQECFPNQKIGKDYCVFVFADSQTGCPTCNRKFYEFLEMHVKSKPNCFIIMYSAGTLYDISGLLSAKNTYNDRKTRKFFPKGHKFEHSEAIIVTNNKIEKIIQIEPKTIHTSLPYLTEKINALK
ncbi:MAG: hypothetical protein LBR28_06515 [Bacteroidales bacterium]|jgi:hypothetical protein|nr:hypothetical protein [Bacteroidales bacterium]